MKSIRWPFAALVIFYILFAGFLLWTMPLFPERVASHFGAGGKVDGWMARSAYSHFIWRFGTIIAIAPCIFQGIRWIPDRWITRSSEEPLEEQREKLNHFLYYLVWMACLCLLAVGGAHYLTLVANRQTPPCLDGPGLGIWVAGFLLGMVVLMVKMIIPFLKTTSGR